MNAECTNTDGSYTCSCLAGYSGDGMTCSGKCRDLSILWFMGCGVNFSDVNECETARCDVNSECTNIDGSYICICNSGYSGDGFSTCDGIFLLSGLRIIIMFQILMSAR